MEIIDQIANAILGVLGLDGTATLALFAVLSLVCRLIGKSIPDDRTGVLGIVRKVCKVLGLYVSNRIESGVSSSSVAKAVVDAPLTLRKRNGQIGTGTLRDAAREKL